MLFGGGLTWSALINGENGLTEAQIADMATRDPQGAFVWFGEKSDVRHASLSSPAFLTYLVRCSKAQVDGGVDQLLMDQIDAGLTPREGYDDYSLRDFRGYLLNIHPETKGWSPADRRWSAYGVDLSDPRVCTNGTMASFSYRGYLAAKDLSGNPNTRDNPLRKPWVWFRSWRDDQAWQTVTRAVRAYAASRGRPVYISANGLAPGVDLQVRGIFGTPQAPSGRIDLATNDVPEWRAVVSRGQAIAGRPVPVVLFHDWGGDPRFPWGTVAPGERNLWLQTRAPEILAAGGIPAFHIRGPFGDTAFRDGTIQEISHQARFYSQHRDLYRNSEFLTCRLPKTTSATLSTALWSCPSRRSLVMHVVNRYRVNGRMATRRGIVAYLPLNSAPKSVTVISPDWEGAVAAEAHQERGSLRLRLPDVTHYVVALLQYDHSVPTDHLRDPVRVYTDQGCRDPVREAFEVRPDRSVEGMRDLGAYLFGAQVDEDWRCKHVFRVHALGDGAALIAHVRSVAPPGAVIQSRIDVTMKAVISLPDMDGEADSMVPEYDESHALAIPPGRHTVSLTNVGAGWVVIDWYEFRGQFGRWQGFSAP
jgi:hypothetical protein